MTTPREITPNVYQITRVANMFLLKTGDGELTLIDAGIPGARNLLLSAVRALGYTPDAVKHILITHADLDHVGALAGIVAATGATVYAGAESKPYIEAAKSPPHLPLPMHLLTGLEPLIRKKAAVDQVIADGDVLPIGGGIQVIHAPGHTPDNSIFYWQREDVLFAADLLTRMRGPLALTPGIITWDMQAARESARKALALEASVICVGHGPEARRDRDAGQFNALLGKLGVS